MGYLEWVAKLYEAAPARWTLTAFVDFLQKALADESAPGRFPLLAGMLDELAPWSAKAGTIVVKPKEFLGRLGQNLEKEAAEPGPYEGVTEAEFWDSVACAMESYRGWVRRYAGGDKPQLVWAKATELVSCISFLMGEPGGPGERTPRGSAGGSGEYPWSAPV